MEEVGTIERLESIIRTQAGHTTDNDGPGDTDQAEGEETEDRTILTKIQPAVEETVQTVEEQPTTIEPVYSDADAGVASPSE
jgi:hypothetical protein